MRSLHNNLIISVSLSSKENVTTSFNHDAASVPESGIPTPQPRDTHDQQHSWITPHQAAQHPVPSINLVNPATSILDNPAKLSFLMFSTRPSAWLKVLRP
jgi:hypothetical protein